MKEEPSTSIPRHPIRVVSARTGLTPDVLRAWERRYGVVEPSRSEAGQRVYSDRDIARLGMLQRAVQAGRAIGQVARLPDAELRALVDEDTASAARAERVPEEIAQSYRRSALEAVHQLEDDRLHALLRQAMLALGAHTFMSDVLAPLLRAIGDEWHTGTISPAHEHAASAVIRRLLEWMSRAFEVAGDAPAIVLATMPGERHEFGAMLAGATAAAAGWRVVYLGSDLPATDIAVAARQSGARVVGLSLVHQNGTASPVTELAELRAALPPGVDVFVGGSGAASLDGRFAELGISRLDDLRQFSEHLAARAGTERR